MIVQDEHAAREGAKRFTIRHTRAEDLPAVLDLYAKARRFMAAHGNPDQWGEVWPPEELIRKDIQLGRSYVCERVGQLAAVFYYNYGKEADPTYAAITEGHWLEDSPYGVIHRLASDGTMRGAGSCCILWAFRQSGHLRVDTHGDNIVMQNLLRKLGFVHCGTVYVREDPFPRLAYEKLSDKTGEISAREADK